MLFSQYEDLSKGNYPEIAKLLFILFQVFMPILLLNMLIAMMGNTYAIVNEKSEKEFLKQVGLCEFPLEVHFKALLLTVGQGDHEHGTHCPTRQGQDLPGGVQPQAGGEPQGRHGHQEQGQDQGQPEEGGAVKLEG